jgi:hypothetical protein
MRAAEILGMSTENVEPLQVHTDTNTHITLHIYTWRDT